MTEKEVVNNNWIMNAGSRAAFWAQAKALGFDHDQVHAVLEVDSMKAWASTMDEALAVLREIKDGQEQKEFEEKRDLGLPTETATPGDGVDEAAAFMAACQMLPEAPALAWTKFQSNAGFVWSMTIRAGLPTSWAVRAMRQTREVIRAFEADAKANGWSPISDGRDVATMPAVPSRPQPQSVTPATPPAAPPMAEDTFQCATLSASITDGKIYWKVKGGRFSQYGVTVWPEVLEAAGFTNLDPLTPYNLAGWTATIAVTSEGKAQKVTRLSK